MKISQKDDLDEAAAEQYKLYKQEHPLDYPEMNVFIMAFAAGAIYATMRAKRTLQDRIKEKI